MTIEQLKHYEHVVATGGDIKPGDSNKVIQQKLTEYNTALRRLHDLNGSDGPLQYAQVPTGGYSGHYEIDPNELHTTITLWENIVDGLVGDQADVGAIQSVDPPAPDKPASRAQADALTKFGDRMYRRNKSMIEYANMYLGQLKKAKQSYELQEKAAQQAMRRQSEGV